MPRPRKPARLWRRPSTDEWIILDRDLPGGQRRTGARGAGGQAAAEQKLQAHLAGKLPARVGPGQLTEVTIGEVLALYAEHKLDEPGAEALSSSIQALAEFWGGKTCDTIKGTTCRAYVRHMGLEREREVVDVLGRRYRVRSSNSPPSCRRYLGILQAALNFAVREGAIVSAPLVTLPPAAPPRDRWLTREEVARLLRYSPPHLRRFILVALATGRRMRAILALRWTPVIAAGGHADTAAGTFHFLPRGEVETRKRRGSCRMTRTIRAHLRRWEREGGSHVVMWRGRPCGTIKAAFERVCIDAGLPDVSPHTLKHTAVTWAFQAGMTIEDAADFFATTAATLERVYRQHSPRYQDRAVAALDAKRGG